jgi:glycosyltransferase involved in cell wall biosynthesis
MQPKVSVVIAYHNEALPIIKGTVEQLRATAHSDDYEIIIVDDGSDKPIEIDGVRIIRHKVRHGLGAAFDTGVHYATGENLILMGSDIRFLDNGWYAQLMDDVDQNPQSLICTQCIALNADKPRGMDMEYRRNINTRAGASLVVYHNSKSDRNYSRGLTSILAAKWLPNDSRKGLVEIPVILGAIYGTKRSWYNHIDGCAGHKVWGTLDPYLSLKSWMFGGNCLCDKDIYTGHIFKVKSIHNIPQAAVYHNKIWVASVLFDDPEKSWLLSYLPKNAHVSQGQAMIDKIYLDKKRAEYKQKTILSKSELEQKMNIKVGPPPTDRVKSRGGAPATRPSKIRPRRI